MVSVIPKGESAYLVSGSRGWLGQVTGQLINELFPHGKLIPLSNRGVNDFWNPPIANTKIIGIVHLAFLTRDKVHLCGNSLYIETNKAITRQIVKIIENAKPSWVVTVSSGAAAYEITPSPYGELKLQEEESLRDITGRVDANLVIGRLWGATGIEMPINRNYAISDLICQALLEKKISIRSGHEVWRRYVDANQYMRVLIETAKLGRSGIVNSGGSLVEIGELARMIKELTGINSVTRGGISATEIIDDYFSRSNEYEELLSELAIPRVGIEEQVKRTLLGHQRQLEASNMSRAMNLKDKFDEQD